MLSQYCDFGFEHGSEPAEVAAELRSSAARAVAEPGSDPSALVAELGWLSIATTPDSDEMGSGVGLRLTCALAEQLGYSGSSVPLAAIAVMPPVLLTNCADTPARDRLLTLAEEVCASVILANPGAQNLPVAVGSPDRGVTLDGRIEWMTPDAAECYLVIAETETGPLVCGVNASAIGPLRRSTVKQADGTLAGCLELDSVAVAPENILATGEQAAVAIANAECAGLMTCAAELLGVSRRAVELTREYVGIRRQFGHLIGEYQVVQHRIVDMWLDCQLAGAALDAGLRVIATGQPCEIEYRRRASSAKARATLSARRVCDAAVQLHGAIGFTDEYELGWYVNRSLVLAAWLGNARLHTERFAALTKVGAGR